MTETAECNCAPAGLHEILGLGQPDSGPASSSAEQPELQSLLQCPVCHEVAKPPIFTCLGSHHLFCGDCHSSVQSCPICKVPIGDTRCLFAEQCMEHMRLPCKYSGDGCTQVLKGTEFRAHLNACPYRPVDCIISRCGKKIPFFQYFDHLKEAHRNKVNGIDNCSKHTVEWWIEGDPASSAKWPPYYFTCYNQVFLYMAVSTGHGMWEWVWMIGNDEDAKRFRVVAKVENSEKTAELTWRGAVHSIRKSVNDIVSSGLAFVTNSKEMRNPYLFRKSGEGQKYFWRTDVEILEVEPPPPGAMVYLKTMEQEKVQQKLGNQESVAVSSKVEDLSKESILQAMALSLGQATISTNGNQILNLNLQTPTPGASAVSEVRPISAASNPPTMGRKFYGDLGLMSGKSPLKEPQTSDFPLQNPSYERSSPESLGKAGDMDHEHFRNANWTKYVYNALPDIRSRQTDLRAEQNFRETSDQSGQYSKGPNSGGGNH